MDTNETFGRRLRRLRKAHELSQEALAQQIFYATDTIKKLEQGLRHPSRQLAVQLADCLGLQGDERASFLALARPAPPAAETNPPRETAAAPPAIPPTNLPAQPTTLIGREQQVAQMRARLGRADVRLLTLTGPGGTGKTCLALQVAAEVLGSFADGVFLVTLASIRDPQLVIETIAAILGVKEAGDQPLLTVLKRHVSDKQLLLVLDNFEQVLDAAPQVAELLSAAPHLKLLVTSRAGLQIYGENEFPVPPLALPDLRRLPPVERLTQYEAVRLFIERARAVKPDFTVTDENALAVAEICVRLDGLPLAIELAAVRVKVLTPPVLLARLSRRLQLLTGGARNLPARQQTLRNAIAWSHELMPEAEQALFAQLAVFVGGCTLEAIEGICNADDDVVSDPLDRLQALVSHSLVQHEMLAHTEPRFQMLETIREYAVEQLILRNEEKVLRDQHAAHFVIFAETAQPKIDSGDQPIWLDRLEAEHDNLRAALSWGLARRDGALVIRISAALWRFWEIRGYFAEGRRWLMAALDQRQDVAPTLLASIYTGAGTMAWRQCDYSQAMALHQQALDLYRALGDHHGAAFALYNVGVQFFYQGDLAGATQCFAESLALSQQISDKRSSAHALLGLAGASTVQGDFATAMQHYAKSLVLSQQLGNTRDIAMTLHNMGEAARYQRDYMRAAELYNQSLAIHRKLGDQLNICYSLVALGSLARYQGNDTQAKIFYIEALVLCQQQGHLEQTAECVEGLAYTAVRQGQTVRAARLFGAAERLREVSGAPLPPIEYQQYTQAIAQAQTALDPAIYEAVWTDGRRLSLEKAIAYGLSDDES